MHTNALHHIHGTDETSSDTKKIPSMLHFAREQPVLLISRYFWYGTLNLQANLKKKIVVWNISSNDVLSRERNCNDIYNYIFNHSISIIKNSYILSNDDFRDFLMMVIYQIDSQKFSRTPSLIISISFLITIRMNHNKTISLKAITSY